MGTRSDGRIISVMGVVNLAENAKESIDFLESFRNEKFQDMFASQIAIENFIVPIKDNL